MATISSIADLERELNKLILSSMSAVATQAVVELKQSVQENVYNTYKPKYYRRTGDLKRSVSKDLIQAGSLTTAKIYHDISKFKQLAPTQNYRIGTHHSTVRNYSPQEYAYFIPATVNDGSSGDLFGEGAWRHPRRYFSMFEDQMRLEFSERLRTQLIKRGLTIRRA